MCFAVSICCEYFVYYTDTSPFFILHTIILFNYCVFIKGHILKILAYLRIAYLPAVYFCVHFVTSVILSELTNGLHQSNLNNKALEETEPPHIITLVSPIALWPVTWCGCPSRFSLCRLNMAALLRSARLLKCSPAALLQVFGKSRHVPGRLYSGAVGTSRARLCVQTVPGRVNVNRYNAAWLRHACRSCNLVVIERWSLL